jgi:hypothetical protein
MDLNLTSFLAGVFSAWIVEILVYFYFGWDKP